MKLTDLISVENINESNILAIADRLGFDVDSIRSNIDLVGTILRGIKESGKYQTLTDVLADEELVDSVKSMLSPRKETVTLDVNSTITCDKCGKIHTLKTLMQRSANA